jgi:hypothetical protein
VEDEMGLWAAVEGRGENGGKEKKKKKKEKASFSRGVFRSFFTLNQSAALQTRDNWYSTTVWLRLLSVTVDTENLLARGCVLKEGAGNQTPRSQLKWPLFRSKVPRLSGCLRTATEPQNHHI